MERFKINLFELDEIGSREFDFSVFIIMLCVTFRNYFRGYGFVTHLNSDLLFEMTFFGGIVYIGLGSIFIHLAHLIPFIDFILNIIGLAVLIAGIINLLISILIFVTKRLVRYETISNN